MIDLRSDTTTRPTPEMREAMMAAEVGDDVYGEDPTVNRLESVVAERLGFDDAVFVPSGTQSNLIALMTHCQRGDEYIVGDAAHTFRYEGGGAAVLGSIQPQPLEMLSDGTMDLDAIERAIKPRDPHFARTRVLCLENTHHGRAVPMDFIRAAASLAHDRGLSMHLDGARMFNAVVDLGIEAADLTQFFDSVSVCLSKGLGAPVGTVLCGGREFIEEARRWKKVTGGGWRQAGILASAGLYALKHNVERMEEDHRRARELASGITGLRDITIDLASIETNMVWADAAPHVLSDLVAFLADHDILVSARDRLRMVTHLDISDRDIERVIDVFEMWSNH